MISLKTNLNSLLIRSNFDFATKEKSRAYERMSSGVQLCCAKDNTADYIIGTRLKLKLSANNICNRNIKQGLTMLDTEMGTLSNLESSLLRIRDLCLEASNDTYGNESRIAIQDEINALTDEFNRVKPRYENDKPKDNQTINNIQKDANIKIFKQNAPVLKSSFVSPVSKISKEQAIKDGYTLIENVSDLKNIKTGDTSAKYILMNDLDLNNVQWDSIVDFQGELNGNGYQIKNLSGFNSLFEQINYATIKNLNITNLSIQGQAGIANYSYSSNIENCSVSGNIYCNVVGNSCGGVIGYGEGNSVANVNVNLNIKNSGRNSYGTGGIIGYELGAVIKNCSFNGNIEGNENVGGIVGYNEMGQIENCSSAGSTKGYSNVGGIAGNGLDLVIDNSHTQSKISGNSSVGALAGDASSIYISNSSYYSSVNPNLPPVGMGDSTGIVDKGKLPETKPDKPNKPDDENNENNENNKSSKNITFQVGTTAGVQSQIDLNLGFDMNFNFDVSTSQNARKCLAEIDEYLDTIHNKSSYYASKANRLDSALQLNQVDNVNLSISKSTIMDTDIAKEACKMVRSQILEQTSTALMQVANQAPDIALKLISNMF